MRKIILAACLALSTAGCLGTGTTGIPTSPAAVAGHTQADEVAMRTAEQAYKLSRTIGELAVDAGLVKGATATKLKNLDNQLYSYLMVARQAYASFNSTDLLSAADNVSRLAGQVRTLVKGDGN